MFSLLRPNRSLSFLELDFMMTLYQRYLPELLLHFLDTEAIVLCFSQKLRCFDSVILKSSTFQVNFSITSLDWEIALRPFITSSKSEAASVALKELVLQIHSYPACQEGPEEALSNLVRCNTTLEKLEIRSFYSKLHFGSLSKALGVNQTLKEFGCVWRLADLEELVDIFVPGISGHQLNSHLKTLKKFPILDSRAKYFMKELCRLLQFNTTLKHVEVVPVGWMKSWIIGEGHRYWKGPQDMVIGLRGHLKLMMGKELRLNTSLQSLVLGYWKLLRVGGEWQMSYLGGPCLKVQTADRYDVKVTMRQ